MSRIGKLPIKIPTNVEIFQKNGEITVLGKFGKLTTNIPDVIDLRQTNETLKIKLKNDTKKVRALHGLYRTLINNMVIGVSKQFNLTLILKGVGYRAIVQEHEIILSLGYSHPVKIRIPNGVTVEIIKNTTINLKSCDKEQLGLFASNIRRWREPEPYKGKGILYQNEQISIKPGKSAK